MKQQGKLRKIVVNIGVGRIKTDSKLIGQIANSLTTITGAKPSRRTATKAIAGFKLKKGDLAGFTVTLRGKRMQDFLTRLTKLALPGDRDFKGIADSSIDQSGNLTIGIKDMTIFPELRESSGSFSHGLELTLVTEGLKREQAKTFYEHLGILFKK